MARPFYRVNGVDMVPFLIEKGVSWSEEDIDEDNSGRTLDGVMQRGLVARKDKHELSYRELTAAETQIVLQAFESQYVTVSTNFHPKRSGTVTLTMYNSSRKAAVSYIDEDGEDVTWQIETIALIER